MPAQIFANRLRMRRSRDTEALIAELGLAGSVIHAPFEPENDAVTHTHAHGENDGGHAHDHSHDHHHD